jgi:pyrophosphate--fructose-6-phosphate 1-phosphotransferase
MTDNKKSPLEIARASYEPKLPPVLRGMVSLAEGEVVKPQDDEKIKQLFPNTYGLPLISFASATGVAFSPINVGVILSGGQAPGGHNVISGLFDGLKALHPDSRLYGFLDGPAGLVEHKYKELTADIIDNYRNSGGFDIIGSGRTKLEEEEQFDKGAEICKKLGISALVIIGGDDSNTNACVLAEYYLKKKLGIQVVGCPKTIDGDLKTDMIEISFGFDTACKVYSDLIGSLQRDGDSSKKYWYFIRLMGRSASHITLECAFQTHPNVTIISEEVAAKNQTLYDVVEQIVQSIVIRANAGLNYGDVLIPEGLIEFVPAMKTLNGEMNELLAHNTEFHELNTDEEKRQYVKALLSKESAEVYRSLPKGIARQLTLDRDPHGNVQVSLIETEKLLIEMVAKRLVQLKAEGKYKGKFAPLPFFFGYEGRCASPSNFDADYCYTLGYTASRLIAGGKSGYMAYVKNCYFSVEQWQPGGVPITSMMNMERRHGMDKPVIKKALVEINEMPFKAFEAEREKWADATNTYVYPGPIQYYGPAEVCDTRTNTLRIETEARKK